MLTEKKERLGSMFRAWCDSMLSHGRDENTPPIVVFVATAAFAVLWPLFSAAVAYFFDGTLRNIALIAATLIGGVIAMFMNNGRLMRWSFYLVGAAIIAVLYGFHLSNMTDAFALYMLSYVLLYVVAAQMFLWWIFVPFITIAAISENYSAAFPFFIFFAKLAGVFVVAFVVWVILAGIWDYVVHGDKRKPSGAVPAPQANDDGYHKLATAGISPDIVADNFGSLYGYDELKDKLRKFAAEWRKDYKKNGILLYGPPGTGKTAFARALAGELKLPLFETSIGTIKSRWLGQTTEQLKDLFRAAQAHAPCVLFIDEIEAVLPARDSNVNMHPDEKGTVAEFLTQSVGLRGTGVLLVGATNFKDSIDSAAIREGRFDLKVEVSLPDLEARKGLMMDVLTRAKVSVDPEIIDRVAARYVGFNVPRLRDVASAVAKKVGKNGKADRGDFRAALRAVQGNMANLPENIPNFADLYLDEPVRSRLEKLATIFRRADDIEEKGGKVPHAVLFYGPPGTGKTTMAKVLAKESGYAFIATTGAELANGGVIEKLHAQASDIRPAIIFIDEAEAAIGMRGSLSHPRIVNEILARMDGVKSVPDVIWIAATNHQEVLDPAMHSRFTEQIELPVPGREPMVRMIRDWAEKHADKIAGSVDLWVDRVAVLLDGRAPRDVHGALGAAYNSAVVEAVAGEREISLEVRHVEEVITQV